MMINKIGPSFRGLKIREDDNTPFRLGMFLDNQSKKKVFDAAVATMNKTASNQDVFLSLSPRTEKDSLQEIVITDDKYRGLVRIFVEDNTTIFGFIQSLSLLNTLLKNNLNSKQ